MKKEIGIKMSLGLAAVGLAGTFTGAVFSEEIYNRNKAAIVEEINETYPGFSPKVYLKDEAIAKQLPESDALFSNPMVTDTVTIYKPPVSDSKLQAIDDALGYIINYAEAEQEYLIKNQPNKDAKEKRDTFIVMGSAISLLAGAYAFLRNLSGKKLSK